jgi:hypothetical protein
MKTEFVSLANSEQFPAGVGVAINRKMLIWNNFTCAENIFFVTVWSGYWFYTDKEDSWENAMEVQEIKKTKMSHQEIGKWWRNCVIESGNPAWKYINDDDIFISPPCLSAYSCDVVFTKCYISSDTEWIKLEVEVAE